MRPDVDQVVSEIEAEWCRLNEEYPGPNDRPATQALFRILKRKDQEIRNLYGKALREGQGDEFSHLRPLILTCDAENRKWLRAWVARHGWPLASRYGSDVDRTAWLVALHADVDVDFQKEMFDVHQSLFEDGETSPVHYAGLHDRIAINEKRGQRWGMFYFVDEGEQVLYPVDEPDGLEARRQVLGLRDERFHR